MAKCNCPAPTALTAISSSNCPVDLKQIQKIAFRRRGEVWDNDGLPITDILNSADWIAFIAAVDDTKIVVTPFIGGNPVITAGDKITEGGGDNSTLNGVELITGTNPSTFEVMFNSISPEQELEFKSLMCEDLLECFFFNSDDNIIAGKGADLTENIGIPVQSVFFGDRQNDGFGTKDSNKMTFSLPSGWSENIAVLIPAFSPLSVL